MIHADAFEVEGGNKLQGEIFPQGAKNEALQVISACLLSQGEVTISNVPDIIDVRKLIQLINGLGVSVQKLKPDTYRFIATDIDIDYCHSAAFMEDARAIRGSVMLIGPLLARFGKAVLPKPGGDKIGRRRLDTHFDGFLKLGAKIQFDQENNIYYIEAEKLTGTYMLMDEISVTGTANIVMAAVLAEGVTKIYNAACEPYLQQLCTMLNKMGAKIEGIGTNLLVIEGVDRLGDGVHEIMPDFIEIGSFIGLAAMTQSEITIKNAKKAELGLIPNVFGKLGVQMEWRGEDLYVPEQSNYEVSTFMDGSILTVYDAPWPGFTPDLLSILLVVATQARGSVLIHQKMFESRLFFVDKLIDMGAQIILCDPHRATVIGLDRKAPLRGINMSSPDIRAGVALLIAALSAKGNSTIYNIHQIDRGYQNIDKRLNAIGANIKRL